MNLHLKRNIFSSTTTLGVLSADGKEECFTLEDALPKLSPTLWTKETAATYPEAKVYGKTCIPYGTYQVILDMSTRFKRIMPHVLDVPLFEGIRIHAGFDHNSTLGCIITGRLIGAGFKLVDSKTAYDALFAKLEKSAETTITID